MKKLIIVLLSLWLLSACDTVIYQKSDVATDYDLTFSDKDLNANYDTSDASNLELSGSEDVKINKAGTYVLSGELNASLIIEVSKEEKIQLVLNNLTINSNDFASIYIIEADKVIITLASDTTNTLKDSGDTYNQIDENNVDGVIFSKADLTINGSGTLNIEANYDHGIVSKDDLIITGGTYNITSKGQGLSGKDDVKIYDGNFTIDAGTAGIKSDNDEDDYRGFIYIENGSFVINSVGDSLHASNLIRIEGGTFEINSDDDALHSDSDLIISSGTINIESCYEGLEGQYINISGGDINIYADDDGINAADGSTNGMMASTDAYIRIDDGNIYINARGDGVDSNGDVYLYGGNIIVEGPEDSGNAAFDYETGGYAYGSETIMIGSSGMAESFSEGSSQANLLYSLSSNYAANTKIEILKDEEVVFSLTSTKRFSSILVTSSKFAIGDTITINIGDDSYTYTFESLNNSYGQNSDWGMGGQGNIDDSRGGGMKDEDNQAMPGMQDANPGEMKDAQDANPGEMPEMPEQGKEMEKEEES